MINIYVKSGDTIRLGREGTKGVRRVIYDFTRWVDLYGVGSIQLVVMRPGDSAPYPVDLTVEGEKAIWNVSAADTAIPGHGECEWRYFVGDAMEKSEIFETYVENALGEAAEDAPEAQQPWVDKVLDAAVRAETAADRAEAVATSARVENGVLLVGKTGSGTSASVENGVLIIE